MDNTVHRYCFGINKLFYKKEKTFGLPLVKEESYFV